MNAKNMDNRQSIQNFSYALREKFLIFVIIIDICDIYYV